MPPRRPTRPLPLPRPVTRWWRRRSTVLLGLVVVAALGYGVLAVTVLAKPKSSATVTETRTPEQIYTDRYTVAFRSTGQDQPVLLDATLYLDSLASALQSLPAKSAAQEELATALQEFNSTGELVPVVVTASVLVGELPADRVLEATTLTDDRGRAYPLLTSQPIVASLAGPAQVQPVRQRTLVLFFQPPDGTAQEPPASFTFANQIDGSARTATWDLNVLTLTP